MAIKLSDFLSNPHVFRFFNSLIIGDFRNILAKEYVKAKKEDRILDIGCGTGDILESLPRVEYLGFDMNKKYIDFAMKRYGDKGKFFCDKVTKKTVKDGGVFDIVVASNVLHHLNNEEAIELFELAKFALKGNGALITVDPCYTESQSPIARFLFSNDRGKYVRTLKGYRDIGEQVFNNINAVIRQGLLRIPYTHLIMVCKNEDSI